jgi:hypothetical protein
MNHFPDIGNMLHCDHFVDGNKMVVARFPNPNGIESISPGLRGTSYPGWTKIEATTPTGLHQTSDARGCNPFRVDAICFTVSQGSSCLATLGQRVGLKHGHIVVMSRRDSGKVAGAQARHERSHRIGGGNGMRPGGCAQNCGQAKDSTAPAGADGHGASDPVVVAPSSLDHRLPSGCPSGTRQMPDATLGWMTESRRDSRTDAPQPADLRQTVFGGGAAARGLRELVPAVGERTCPPPPWLCEFVFCSSQRVASRRSARTSPLGDGWNKFQHSTASRQTIARNGAEILEAW